ncbi:MAG TPA: hypothetical protein VF131_09745 [Blastocatellia bacterium]|nr:hypothetical protein [Blastocatellia bacterium]
MADNKGSDENAIVPGTPVIVYMHSPREKMWGLLTELNASGVFIHGIDLNTFEDWTMMLVRGERNIGLSHVFFPMWRVERIMVDETVDDIPSMADKFHSRVGLTIHDFLKR